MPRNRRGPPEISLAGRIQDHHEDLPPSEKRIADLILEFPGEVSAYSATELAELANSSKAAVTRLVRRLGFTNFEAARRAARDAQDWGSPLYLMNHEHIESGQVTRSQLRGHLERNIANMARTFDIIDLAVFDEVVDAIVAARRVWLVGFRNSRFLAGYACQQLSQVREGVSTLPDGGETLAETIACMTQDDLAIVIGFRRRISRLSSIMETVHQLGVPLVYITDPTARKTMGFARWKLIVEIAGVGVFDSYAAAFSLIHFLSTNVVTRTGTAGRNRLETIEKLHDRLDEFK